MCNYCYSPSATCEALANASIQKVFSSIVIEHLTGPVVFLEELLRVAAKEIEVHCPNGEYQTCHDETQPLHLHDFSLSQFRKMLEAFSNWEFNVHWDYSQSEPWEIVIEGLRKGGCLIE